MKIEIIVSEKRGIRSLEIPLSRIGRKLGNLNCVFERMEKHMANLDSIAASLTRMTSASQGAAALLNSLRQEVRDLKSHNTDPETASKIDALDAKIQENTQILSDAIGANVDGVGANATQGSAPVSTDGTAVNVPTQVIQSSSESLTPNNPNVDNTTMVQPSTTTTISAPVAENGLQTPASVNLERETVRDDSIRADNSDDLA